MKQICGGLKEVKNVHSVIVFCQNVDIHERWTCHYKKIKLVSNNISLTMGMAQKMLQNAAANIEDDNQI